MSKIELIDFKDTDDIYKLIYKWCSEKFIYEWFEQRVLSYDEIVAKYRKKLLDGKQKLFLISYDEKLIGFVQIYRYSDLVFDELKKYKNIYEYDIFIGEKDYLYKGIGKEAISIINEFIYDNYLADCIILRPFKRNISAIKCYQKCGFRLVKEYDGKDTIGNNEKIVILINNK